MFAVDSDTVQLHKQSAETILKIFHNNFHLTNELVDRVFGGNTTEKRENIQVEDITQHDKITDQRLVLKSEDKFENQVENLSKVVNHCKTCNKNFPSEVDLRKHISEDQHRIRYIYQKSRKDLVETKLQICIMAFTTSHEGINYIQRREPLYPNAKGEAGEQEVIYISGKDKVAGTIRFNILNCFTETVTLVDILKINSGFEIQNMSEQTTNDSMFIVPLDQRIMLSRGASTLIMVKLSITSVGTNEFFLFFKIYKSKRYLFIMKKLCVIVESDFTAFEPTQPLAFKPLAPTPVNKPSEGKFVPTPEKIVRQRPPRQESYFTAFKPTQPLAFKPLAPTPVNKPSEGKFVPTPEKIVRQRPPRQESYFTAFKPTQPLAFKPLAPTPVNKPSEWKFVPTPKEIVRQRPPRQERPAAGKRGNYLENYEMPTSLANLLNNGMMPYHRMTPKEAEMRRKILDMIETGLNTKNYLEFFSLLLFIENHQMSVDILKYRLFNVPLHIDLNTSLVALSVPGLAEKRPSVLKYDSIMITVKGIEGIEYEGKVQKVEDTRVLLKFNTKFMKIFIPNMKVDVRFEFPVRPHNLMQRTLEFMVNRGLISYICFPSHYGIFPIKPIEIRWINRSVEENERQREAVERIVMGTSRPAPYLLFGPPGTGKTVTIVEAILQILRTNDDARVLVTAPSNSAVDNVSSRLLKYLPSSQLMRIYSPSREWFQIPDELKDSCNYEKETGNFEFLSGLDIIYYKVIAVTMVTAGRLIENNVPQNHFSHIFIDECAQGLEPEALISVSGLMGIGSPKSPPRSLLVLAGDHKQLGPVLRSSLAKKLGLEKSLLERLMTSVDLYKRDERNNYNPDVITKLVKNFRSHPAILNLPNKLFYEGELMPSGKKSITHSACNWELLPKKGVPIIFHGVEGKEQRDHLSPSYFNTSEIHQVVWYLKEILSSKFSGAKILEPDIGIISPYRRQVQKIRTSISINRIGSEVSVGSVEEFQGQERSVIIISTVRSDPERISLDKVFRLGFLREPKRFNVAVTRAKSLLIIIGNPNILQRDPCWRELLKHCIKLGCYKGVPFKLEESFSDEEEDDSDDDLPIPLKNAATSTNVYVNSVQAKLEKLSLRANNVSAVTKMIEPPWESHA